KKFAKLGLKACEIAFTYGVYIKESQKKEIENIKKTTEKLDIKLSIHAPYWINLNSDDKNKVRQSKERILRCCKIGEMLGAYCVVFHPGYYLKKTAEETYKNIKIEILDLITKIKKNKWKIKLCPETTGKVNVFGKEEEILKLVKETGCFFTIDFAHLYARSKGKMSYKEMYEKVKDFKKLHCHFSGIEYGEKGEKKHKLTPESEIKKLLLVLPKNKEIVIINESPSPVEDSVKMKEIYVS
ncbi:MAG: TIM barrel protein, partial [Nanoarchaeota archaeon]|nr:TIM barrel protein [Nanoarchaeota archaeon]